MPRCKADIRIVQSRHGNNSRDRHEVYRAYWLQHNETLYRDKFRDHKFGDGEVEPEPRSLAYQ